MAYFSVEECLAVVDSVFSGRALKALLRMERLVAGCCAKQRSACRKMPGKRKAACRYAKSWQKLGSAKEAAPTKAGDKRKAKQWTEIPKF